MARYRGMSEEKRLTDDQYSPLLLQQATGQHTVVYYVWDSKNKYTAYDHENCLYGKIPHQSECWDLPQELLYHLMNILRR